MHLELISRTKLTSLFPPNILARICRMTEEIYIPPGELLMLQGDSGTDMYVVKEGELEVINLTAERIAAIVKSGDAISRPNTAESESIVFARLGSGAVLGEVRCRCHPRAREIHMAVGADAQARMTSKPL